MVVASCRSHGLWPWALKSFEQSGMLSPGNLLASGIPKDSPGGSSAESCQIGSFSSYRCPVTSPRVKLDALTFPLPADGVAEVEGGGSGHAADRGRDSIR